MSGARRPGGTPGAEVATVHVVGSGPGPVDLLTVRASRLIAMSGTCLYSRTAPPAESMSLCPPTARVVDIADSSAGQVLDEIRAALGRGDRVVALFAGDPCQHEQATELLAALDGAGIARELVPGIAHPGYAPAPGLALAEDPGSGDPLGDGAHVPASAGEPGLILVLGGTAEARQLADLLVTAGLEVVTSLAGRIARPRLPRGEVRIGGFGGVDGLTSWLRENAVSAVIDATGPFAEQISAEAVRASSAAGVPLLRVQRPSWGAAEGDEWIRVPDMPSAVAVVRERFRRPMLTVGKHGAAAFAEDDRGSYLIRSSEPPPGPLPHRYLLVLDRGPFGVDSERTLMSRHRIDVLVTRDSGGQSAAAKLEAARSLHIPVVMVDRPRDAAHVEESGPDTVDTVEDAARWLVSRFGSR